jgi:folate-binding protein YgfZ
MSAYRELREEAAWIDLSTRGTLRVTGEDRARLLHAMSTNHIQDLAEGSGLYAFFLNDKGRILADANIFNLGESLLLDTEPETAASLRDHLDRYIIADDVTLEDETAQWSKIGLEGPTSDKWAVELGLIVPAKPYSIVEWGDGWIARATATGPQGVRLWLSPLEKERLVSRFEAAGIPQASAADARVVRLENGMPRYGEDISQRFLVQETQALHAMHFSKGCYLGQEIVERVRSRGQVHRLLSPVRIETSTVPEPGTKLLAEGAAVGEITSAAYSSALGEVTALAYVRTEAFERKPALTVAGSEPEVRARLV